MGFAFYDGTSHCSRKIRCEHGERGRDDQVVMAARRLQSEAASRTRLEDELRKLPAQKLTPGRMVRDRQLSAPHGGAEPLDQARLANNQAVTVRRPSKRAIAANQADTDVRRCLWQQFCGSIAEAALIEDEEVEPREVWCDQGELLTQWRLRQAQCGGDGEPGSLDVEEHERAVVTSAGEVETGDDQV
jgi:hypothetical protein